MQTLCPNGHDNADGSAFCNTCGASIPPVAAEMPVAVETPVAAVVETGASAAARPLDRVRALWSPLSPRAKFLVPVVSALAIVGIIAVAALVPRAAHVPTEADYRHAFEDISAVLISTGAEWDKPAPYPSDLSAGSETLFEQVRTLLIDPQCASLAAGDEEAKSDIDLAVAIAKDNGIGDDLGTSLDRQQSVLDASVKHICPQFSGVASEASKHIDVLRVLG